MAGERIDIPLIIGGKEFRTGDTAQAVMPHDHAHVLADWHKATARARRRGDRGRSRAAQRDWANWAWEDRAAVFLKAAELLTTTWRATLNAATMLGQSKTAFQAEIDSACELIDFWRFNPHYAQELYDEQPLSDHTMWNQLDYRAARGIRLRGDAVQLHVDRRQPADRAGADGQHGDLEAGVERDALGVLHHEAARGGGASAGRDQLRARRRRDDLRRAARAPRSRRRALHRQHRRLQQHVEDDRREHVELPLVSAHRRRDGRQGLHRRACVGRSRGARRRDRARRLRVPGTEVLGGEPRLRPAIALAGGARPDGRDHGRA